MFHSIPFTPRKVEATESRLKAVYDAAKLGLKGDALALAAGMLPIEYRQLTQLDPVVELAADKGKADGEIEMAQILRKAALDGDAKAALEILKHQHGWVAKQAISVEVDQRISITGALAEATKRALTVEDAVIIENTQHAIDHIQRWRRTRADVQIMGASDQGQPVGVCDVRVSMGSAWHTAGAFQRPTQMAAGSADRDCWPHQTE